MLIKHRNLNTVFDNISKTIWPTSDSFLLIMSHIGFFQAIFALTSFGILFLLYHQEVPLDQSRLGDDEMIVCVAHFQKELFCTFGTPFLLRIKDVSTMNHICLSKRLIVLYSLPHEYTQQVHTQCVPIKYIVSQERARTTRVTNNVQNMLRQSVLLFFTAPTNQWTRL